MVRGQTGIWLLLCHHIRTNYSAVHTSPEHVPPCTWNIHVLFLLSILTSDLPYFHGNMLFLLSTNSVLVWDLPGCPWPFVNVFFSSSQLTIFRNTNLFSSFTFPPFGREIKRRPWVLPSLMIGTCVSGWGMSVCAREEEWKTWLSECANVQVSEWHWVSVE